MLQQPRFESLKEKIDLYIIPEKIIQLLDSRSLRCSLWKSSSFVQCSIVESGEEEGVWVLVEVFKGSIAIETFWMSSLQSRGLQESKEFSYVDRDVFISSIDKLESESVIFSVDSHIGN